MQDMYTWVQGILEAFLKSCLPQKGALNSVAFEQTTDGTEDSSSKLFGGKEFYAEQTVIAKVLRGEHVTSVIKQPGPQRDGVLGVRSESWQGLNYIAP